MGAGAMMGGAEDSAPLESKLQEEQPQEEEQPQRPQRKRPLEVPANGSSPQAAVGAPASGAEGDSLKRSKVRWQRPWCTPVPRLTWAGMCQSQDKSRRKGDRAKGERLSVAERLGARSQRMLRKLERTPRNTPKSCMTRDLFLWQAMSGPPRRNDSLLKSNGQN